MRFVFSPPGSTEAIASGYDWEPDPSAMHPFSGIATALNAEVVVIG